MHSIQPQVLVHRHPTRPVKHGIPILIIFIRVVLVTIFVEMLRAKVVHCWFFYYFEHGRAGIVEEAVSGGGERIGREIDVRLEAL